MLHRTVPFVLNRAKLIVPTKCVQITKSGLKTSVKCRVPEDPRPEKMLASSVLRIDNSNAQKKAINLFLDAAEVLLDSRPKGQDFRQTISDCKQMLAQSSIPIDHEILGFAVKTAVAKNRFSLVPHLLRVGLWVCGNIPSTLHENICSLLLVSRKWDTLWAVLQFHEKHSIPRTSKLLNILLRTFLHWEMYAALQATAVQKMFSKHGCKLDRETFNILIEASVANRDMAACRYNVVQMIREGFEINEETHHAILVRMVAMGPNQALEATIFTSLQGINPSLDTVILNSLIRLRSIARDDVMLRGYIAYLRRGLPANAATLDSAPAPYWEADPNISTIAILVEHFGRRKQLNAALESFRLITLLKLEPSTEAVGHMISAYGNCGRIQDALSLAAELSNSLPAARRERSYKLLQQFGWDGLNIDHDIFKVTANVYIFNALLKLVIEQRGLEAVVIILDLMEAHYVAPDDDTAGIYLSFLDKHKNTNSDDIICVLYRLVQYPLNWRQRHVNVILHSILREHKKLLFGPGGWKAASVFLNRNRERRLARHSTLQRARNIFGIMDGAVSPENGFSGRLRDILVTVDRSGARHDHATYSIRMIYHARITRDAGAVEELYQTMLRHDLLPNAYHIAALMEAFCFTGQVEKAQQTLSEAIVDGIVVNRVHYTLLIREFGNQGDPDSAYRVYQQMIHNNVRPDIAALDAVIRSYFMVKDYSIARKALFQLWRTVLPLDTVPPPTASLGDAMARLRELEKMERPNHSKYGRTDAAIVKRINTKWRRTSSRRKLKANPPALRGLISLGREFQDEESGVGLSVDEMR